MAANNDLLDSVGGSLLNDLLSDLNAAPASGANPNDDSDDLFALLEQELSATYGEPAPTPDASLPPPPGMQLGSAAAFVVHQQPPQPPAGAPVADAGGDAWSQSLSQFGSLSIASDFLAADTAAKKQDPAEATKEKAPSSGGILGKLFEADEEYSVDEKVVFEGQLGKKKAEKQGEKPKAKAPEAAMVKEAAPAAPTQAPPPPAMGGPTMGMPPPMAGPPMGMHPMMPPMGMPPPMGMMPPPMGMVPPQMMGMPPQGMPPMGMPPHAMVPPPPPGAGGVPPLPAQPAKGGKSGVLNKRDFPALGAEAVEPEEEEEAEERDEKEAEPAVTAPPPVAAPEIRSYFNNANPNAPPVDAKRVETNLMPSRDLCYIVNSMVRPLQSLDAYSDDYYHWSVVNRSSQRRAQIGAAPFYVANPNPVDKSVKAIAQKREEKFQTNVKSRAEAFATEKKSLGQMVKTNVKRPKALLTTPVLSKGEKDEGGAPDATDSKYTAEQKSSRVSMWKARVCIDKGYTAFLALIELRRLLQSHSAAPQLASELMVDVKANVELMHASLGIKSKADPKGGRKVEIDQSRLASTLSLPKGRVFCARAIEEGILPHPSACNLLPAAVGCIFSWPVPAAEGEDRLLFALTSLVQNPHPRIDPAILYQCLDALTLGVTEGKCDLAAVTQSQMRMKLLHAILSIGKAGCANSQLSEGWSAKEKVLMEALGKIQ